MMSQAMIQNVKMNLKTHQSLILNLSILRSRKNCAPPREHQLVLKFLENIMSKESSKLKLLRRLVNKKIQLEIYFKTHSCSWVLMIKI
jgi:hypothetical protein